MYSRGALKHLFGHLQTHQVWRQFRYYWVSHTNGFLEMRNKATNTTTSCERFHLYQTKCKANHYNFIWFVKMWINLSYFSEEFTILQFYQREAGTFKNMTIPFHLYWPTKTSPLKFPLRNLCHTRHEHVSHQRKPTKTANFWQEDKIKSAVRSVKR